MIGIFDSGIGGLSVWREIIRELPEENTLYVADQAHVPYGYRSMDEIRMFCAGIVEFLLEQGADIIVIACNAASAAALHYLRDRYPDLPFVGMEPAVKPAAGRTQTGIVGVIATQTTFQGKLFADLIGQYGNHVKVLTRIGHGLVETVEAGVLDTPETENLLKMCVSPLIDAGADQLVLGCTHYPFLMPVIKKLAGPKVSVIDPAPAVALQVARIVKQRNLINQCNRKGCHLFFTSGQTHSFFETVQRLVPCEPDSAVTSPVCWHSGRLLSHKSREILEEEKNFTLAHDSKHHAKF
jgi:glutamate racemase